MIASRSIDLRVFRVAGLLVQITAHRRSFQPWHLLRSEFWGTASKEKLTTGLALQAS
jgi:hypothetical protein